MNRLIRVLPACISVGLRPCCLRLLGNQNYFGLSKFRVQNGRNLLNAPSYDFFGRSNGVSSKANRRQYDEYDSSDGERRRRKKGSDRIFFLPAGIWATFQYYTGMSTPPLSDAEIKAKIIEASKFCRKQKYDDALAVLHEALFKAEQDKNDSAINFCLDMMANIYYFIGRYDEAEQSFASLIQRLLDSGEKIDGVPAATSPAMVELSLKLADIYALKGDFEKAESGFEFCVQTQKVALEKSIDDYQREPMKLGVAAARHDIRLDSATSDPYALYGLVLETYGRYLARKGRIEDSQLYVNRALEMALELYGPTHPHTLSVMNNFAIICMGQNEFEVAERYLRQVVNRAPLLAQNEELITGFYTNYAEALWHLGKHEEALDYARRAANIASDHIVSPDAKRRTEEYLKQLEKDWKTESKKKGKK